MDQQGGYEKWTSLQSLLCRGSPLAHPDFEPSSEVSLTSCYWALQPPLFRAELVKHSGGHLLHLHSLIYVTNN